MCWETMLEVGGRRPRKGRGREPPFHARQLRRAGGASVTAGAVRGNVPSRAGTAVRRRRTDSSRGEHCQHWPTGPETTGLQQGVPRRSRDGDSSRPGRRGLQGHPHRRPHGGGRWFKRPPVPASRRASRPSASGESPHRRAPSPPGPVGDASGRLHGGPDRQGTGRSGS